MAAESGYVAAAERAAADGPAEEPEAAERDSTADPANDAIERVLAAWDAMRALLLAARGFAVALAGLARSEWALARASVPWVIGLGIVLVGLALSLWLTLIAVVAWALYLATGSVGWALAGLVALHVMGVTVAAWALRRGSRLLTMPETRAQVHDLLTRARGSAERKP